MGHPLRKHTKQNIFLIHIGQCHKRFSVFQIFFKQQVLACTIPVDHRCIRQQICQQLTSLFGLLDDHNAHFHLQQHSCKEDSDGSATHDHTVSHLIGL